jgi:hypothetical protein
LAALITYVGLDVHKRGIVVAVAEDGLRGEVREYGRIANTPAALDRLARKLSREGVKLRFCYEAGPCGYGIQRHFGARARMRRGGAIADPETQPRQTGRIPPIRLDPVAGSLWDAFNLWERLRARSRR